MAAARDYVALALTLLEPQAPALIAIGGFSGTGKSTQAALLAPPTRRRPARYRAALNSGRTPQGRPRIAGVTMPTLSTPAPLAASITATTSP